MTNAEIYNEVVYSVFGDTPNVPASVQQQLISQNGLVKKAHEKIQTDANYWFMRDKKTVMIKGKREVAIKTTAGSTVIICNEPLNAGECLNSNNFFGRARIVEPVGGVFNEYIISIPASATGDATAVVYTDRVALPQGFKTENSVSLRYSQSSLSMLSRMNATKGNVILEMTHYVTGTPTEYFLDGEYLYFPCGINSDCTLVLDYYKYLMYNTAMDYEDSVMIHGSDVIVSYCALRFSSMLQDVNRMQFFSQMYADALVDLRRKNLMREASFTEYKAQYF